MPPLFQPLVSNANPVARGAEIRSLRAVGWPAVKRLIEEGRQTGAKPSDWTQLVGAFELEASRGATPNGPAKFDPVLFILRSAAHVWGNGSRPTCPENAEWIGTEDQQWAGWQAALTAACDSNLKPQEDSVPVALVAARGQHWIGHLIPRCYPCTQEQASLPAVPHPSTLFQFSSIKAGLCESLARAWEVAKQFAPKGEPMLACWKLDVDPRNENWNDHRDETLEGDSFAFQAAFTWWQLRLNLKPDASCLITGNVLPDDEGGWYLEHVDGLGAKVEAARKVNQHVAKNGEALSVKSSLRRFCWVQHTGKFVVNRQEAEVLQALHGQQEPKINSVPIPPVSISVALLMNLVGTQNKPIAAETVRCVLGTMPNWKDHSFPVDEPMKLEILKRLLACLDGDWPPHTDASALRNRLRMWSKAGPMDNLCFDDADPWNQRTAPYSAVSAPVDESLNQLPEQEPVARDAMIAQLAFRLTPGCREVVWGDGGVGKTTIIWNAIERDVFGVKTRFPGGVIWLNLYAFKQEIMTLDGIETMILTELLRLLKLPQIDVSATSQRHSQMNDDEAVAETAEALAAKMRARHEAIRKLALRRAEEVKTELNRRVILIVFEGAEDLEKRLVNLVDCIAGKPYKAGVVIATRVVENARLPDAFRPINVKKFDAAEGLQLIRHYMSPQTTTDDDSLSEIVKMYDGLAVLLELAGKCISIFTNPSDYVSRARKEGVFRLLKEHGDLGKMNQIFAHHWKYLDPEPQRALDAFGVLENSLVSSAWIGAALGITDQIETIKVIQPLCNLGFVCRMDDYSGTAEYGFGHQMHHAAAADRITSEPHRRESLMPGLLTHWLKCWHEATTDAKGGLVSGNASAINLLLIRLDRLMPAPGSSISLAEQARAIYRWLSSTDFRHPKEQAVQAAVALCKLSPQVDLADSPLALWLPETLADPSKKKRRSIQPFVPLKDCDAETLMWRGEATHWLGDKAESSGPPDYVAAESWFGISLALFANATKDNKSVSLKRDHAVALGRYGNVVMRLQKHEIAVDMLQRQQIVWAELCNEPDPKVEWQESNAYACLRLGDAHAACKNHGLARHWWQQASRAFEKLLAKDANNEEWKRAHQIARERVANIVEKLRAASNADRQAGDHAMAEHHFDKAEELYRKAATGFEMLIKELSPEGGVTDALNAANFADLDLVYQRWLRACEAVGMPPAQKPDLLVQWDERWIRDPVSLPFPGATLYTADSDQIFADLAGFHPLTSFDEAEFLTMLRCSLSLSTPEKKRVVDSFPALSQFQIDELKKVFTEESAEFDKIRDKERNTISWLEEVKAWEWSFLRLMYLDELRNRIQEGVLKQIAQGELPRANDALPTEASKISQGGQIQAFIDSRQGMGAGMQGRVQRVWQDRLHDAEQSGDFDKAKIILATEASKLLEQINQSVADAGSLTNTGLVNGIAQLHVAHSHLTELSKRLGKQESAQPQILIEWEAEWDCHHFSLPIFGSDGPNYSDENDQILLDLVSFHPLTTFDEAAFLQLLHNSLSLDVPEKKKVVDAVPTLSQYQIDELIKVWQEETHEFQRLQTQEAATIVWLKEVKKFEWRHLRRIYLRELKDKAKAENEKANTTTDAETNSEKTEGESHH